MHIEVRRSRILFGRHCNRSSPQCELTYASSQTEWKAYDDNICVNHYCGPCIPACVAFVSCRDSYEVESGSGTAALLELYTSQGCSSCQPADREVSRLRQGGGERAVVVPLALHVTSSDQVGWKDDFAQKILDCRQALLLANGHGGAVQCRERTLTSPDT
jgi:hypothetical protein